MSSDAENLVVGSAAPDFALKSSDGSLIHLSDYRGSQHVVLYFMRAFT
jgi:peroxiredoxin